MHRTRFHAATLPLPVSLFASLFASLVCISAAQAQQPVTPEYDNGGLIAPQPESARQRERGEQIIKIGHVAPISGPMAALGKDNENGARMAIDELNTRNLVIDGKPAKFVLVAEDDAGAPQKGVQAAQRLVSAGVNGVVGHLTSGASIPASRIYYDARIPQISPSAVNPLLTAQGFDTTFRMTTSDAQLSGILGRYAVNNMKVKSIAIIHDGTAYGQGAAIAFQIAASAQGGEIVAGEHINGAGEISAVLSKIQPLQPDLIFFGGMDNAAVELLKQMKQMGIAARFMGSDGICTDALAKRAGTAMTDGQVTCGENGGIPQDHVQDMNSWRATYQQRFHVPVQIYAPYTYDAVMTMAQAMVQAGSSNPQRYLPFLAAIKYHGITGDIEFDPQGNIRNGSASLYTYLNGRRELIGIMR